MRIEIDDVLLAGSSLAQFAGDTARPELPGSRGTVLHSCFAPEVVGKCRPLYPKPFVCFGKLRESHVPFLLLSLQLLWHNFFSERRTGAGRRCGGCGTARLCYLWRGHRDGRGGEVQTAWIVGETRDAFHRGFCNRGQRYLVAPPTLLGMGRARGLGKAVRF